MRIKIRLSDKLFSNYIRKRDNYECQRCHKKYQPPTQALHCSHFWGRARENTRFDPDNADSLCYGCHTIWGHGDGREDYISFKKKQLTESGFKKLQVRAFTYKKKDEKLAILFINQCLKSQQQSQK